MKAIWTQPSVTFSGEFWQVDKAEPHIETWQQPHPPLWLGGHAPKAVQRAGRLGDGWIIPPAVEIPDVAQMLTSFHQEQAKRGIAPSLQPLRRNIFLGRDRQDALAQFMRASANRYLHYAKTGHETWDVESVETRFNEIVGGHILAGSADSVINEIKDIASAVPVNPLIMRAGWPDMDPEWFITYVNSLGSELVPGIKEIIPFDLAAR